jgi:hypothetical protein
MFQSEIPFRILDRQHIPERLRMQWPHVFIVGRVLHVCHSERSEESCSAQDRLRLLRMTARRFFPQPL